MSGRHDELDHQVADRLFAAYRATIEDPPYGTTDQALLRAAATHVPNPWSHPMAFAASALIVAALGVLTLIAAPFFRVSHRSADTSQIASREAQTDRSPKISSDDSLIYSTFGASYAQQYQVQQAALAMQVAAESQYATFALQIEATQPDLYDVTMELERRALRVQLISPSVRRYK